jgi:hypothetical protein
MSEREVRFRPGTMVSPGEYRNCDTGTTRYFDGNTPLPGSANSASWQQVSDHHHPNTGRPRAVSRSAPDTPSSTGVHFSAGSVVSAGEYRNMETRSIRYFDGSTPLPGGANSASWQQVSDHHHPAVARGSAGTRTEPGSPSSTGVRFTAGTMVSAGEYRNCETGAVHFFDGNTPLPGGANAASWQQISDHFHSPPPRPRAGA